ncbi:MAG TPA: NDP-sugar synthase [Nocardioidaceae bacterium]|nr:NDP-sugar synthase [Nocardioidaceae bacterium]
MDAVIIAGGLGTRLRPLTQHRPKHLLPVGGVPFVEHQISKLAAAGFERVVLATSYRAEAFEPVLGDGSRWSVRLTYVTEDEPLGTAGAIRNAAEHLDARGDDPVVVLNGDVLSGHDLAAQVAFHRGHHADATLHLVTVDDARAYGCVPTDRDGLVLAFLEKSPDPVSRQVNAGCYVLNAAVIDDIPVGRAVSVERETFPALVTAGRRVLGFLDPSYWLDLGTPEALVRGSSDLVRGIARSPAYRHPPAEARLDPASTVEPGAFVRGGSSVGPGAVVHAGAVVEGTVVCGGAVVAAGARVVDSVLGPGSVVGPGATVSDSVLGDDAGLGAGCELRAGVRVWGGVQIPDGAIRFSPDV